MTEAEQNRSAAFTLAIIFGLVVCIFSATIGGIVIALAVGYLIVAGAAADIRGAIIARLEVSRRSIDG